MCVLAFCEICKISINKDFLYDHFKSEDYEDTENFSFMKCTLLWTLLLRMMKWKRSGFTSKQMNNFDIHMATESKILNSNAILWF